MELSTSDDLLPFSNTHCYEYVAQYAGYIFNILFYITVIYIWRILIIDIYDETNNRRNQKNIR
jgi:hypothetical protein